jgi:hypothetical protein
MINDGADLQEQVRLTRRFVAPRIYLNKREVKRVQIERRKRTYDEKALLWLGVNIK